MQAWAAFRGSWSSPERAAPGASCHLLLPAWPARVHGGDKDTLVFRLRWHSQGTWGRVSAFCMWKDVVRVQRGAWGLCFPETTTQWLPPRSLSLPCRCDAPVVERPCPFSLAVALGRCDCGRNDALCLGGYRPHRFRQVLSGTPVLGPRPPAARVPRAALLGSPWGPHGAVPTDESEKQLPGGSSARQRPPLRRASRDMAEQRQPPLGPFLDARRGGSPAQRGVDAAGLGPGGRAEPTLLRASWACLSLIFAPLAAAVDLSRGAHLARYAFPVCMSGDSA